jgi:hypothetical protein
MSFLSDCRVCCQVEVSATSWSFIQRSLTDCGVSCVIYKFREWGSHSPRWASALKENNFFDLALTEPSAFNCSAGFAFEILARVTKVTKLRRNWDSRYLDFTDIQNSNLASNFSEFAPINVRNEEKIKKSYFICYSSYYPPYVADPLILNLDTRRMLVISFSLWTFCSRGTNLRRPLNRWLRWIQGLSEISGEYKKILSVTATETWLKFCPAGILVSVPSEISGLSS